MRPPSTAVHICFLELGRRKAAWILVFLQSVLTSASTARGACVCARTRAWVLMLIQGAYIKVMDVRTKMPNTEFIGVYVVCSPSMVIKCVDGGGAHG